MPFLTFVRDEHYMAGFTLPWYVPKKIVISALYDLGFRNITFESRRKFKALTWDNRVPLFDPSTIPGYTDQWSVWATADFAGESARYRVPQEPAWIVSSAQSVPNLAINERAQRLIELLDQALSSHDATYMRQIAERLDTLGFKKTAFRLRLAASRYGRSKLVRIANATGVVGFVVSLGTLIASRIRRH